MPNVLIKPGATIVREMVRDLAPPRWVCELVELRDAKTQASGGVERFEGERFLLVTARVTDVPDLSPREFEQRAFAAYVAIARELASSPCCHAVRFWNHVPFITERADAGRDNYVVFNAGRFRAFSEWFGSPARFERDVATASATGHWGRDLVIHCLAADAPGTAVNNPRQVAPYHYSQRFGPLPPCFARATELQHPAGLLLVGGTASVRGEDSVHTDDLASQCRETFVNLAALIGQALGKKLTPAAPLERWLARFRELRVYYPNRVHSAEIESAIRARFCNLRQLEMLRADLCRSELLVEIEGIADLSAMEARK